MRIESHEVEKKTIAIDLIKENRKNEIAGKFEIWSNQ